MNKDTGGPAFPTTLDDAEQGFSGMTLRDWFAGQALAGIAAEGTYDSSKPDVMASHAYRMADAMLTERIKP